MKKTKNVIEVDESKEEEDKGKRRMEEMKWKDFQVHCLIAI